SSWKTTLTYSGGTWLSAAWILVTSPANAALVSAVRVPSAVVQVWIGISSPRGATLQCGLLRLCHHHDDCRAAGVQCGGELLLQLIGGLDLDGIAAEAPGQAGDVQAGKVEPGYSRGLFQFGEGLEDGVLA